MAAEKHRLLASMLLNTAQHLEKIAKQELFDYHKVKVKQIVHYALENPLQEKRYQKLDRLYKFSSTNYVNTYVSITVHN